jgi:hypothetical protein
LPVGLDDLLSVIDSFSSYNTGTKITTASIPDNILKYRSQPQSVNLVRRYKLNYAGHKLILINIFAVSATSQVAGFAASNSQRHHPQTQMDLLSTRAAWLNRIITSAIEWPILTHSGPIRSSKEGLKVMLGRIMNLVHTVMTKMLSTAQLSPW